MRVAPLVVLLLAFLLPTGAQAYPWMIRHHYASCAACHTDPSGGGLITRYGRAQQELLMTMQYRERGPNEDLPRRAQFLFGAVDLPEWATLAFAVRGGGISRKADDSERVNFPVQMATDIRGHIAYENLRAGAALGYARKRAEAAQLTPGAENTIVSREHWIGVGNEDETVLIRGGRIHIPFGLRNAEHTAWVRELTVTDTNDDQRHGVAVAFNGEGLRGELMGIIGNLQVSPGEFREHGYSGYLEAALSPYAAVGVSSLMGRSRINEMSFKEFFLRQSHGVFARWAINKPLVLMAEADLLYGRSQTLESANGHATFFQADLEPVQGLHFIATLETRRQGDSKGTGGWGSVEWFFASHSGVRFDAMLHTQTQAATTSNTVTLLAQLHFLL